MKAVRVLQTGNIDDIKIEDIPVDTMHSDELLVKVNYCGINPVDWKCIEHGGFHLPYTIGSDVSGIVEKTGSSVQKFKKGDAVLGSLEWAKQGAFAEYVITKEEYIVSKTAMLSFREAAALPLAGLTAWQGLFDKLQLQKGEKILIQAGAGGVGLFALQFAKRKGAFVAVTASARNTEFLKSMGADLVLDYNHTELADMVADFDWYWIVWIRRSNPYKF